MRPQPDFIHEFVPGTSERTLLLLHGTGGNERDLIPLARELDPRAALLSPRGKVLENGMPRFFSKSSTSWKCCNSSMAMALSSPTRL